MKTSEQINELADALSKAQAAMKPAIKASDNPAFHSKYADLSAVWDVAKKPLTDNGLCVIQMPVHSGDGLLHLTTRLAHKSGQWVEETMSIPVAKDNAHGYGSGITYCKRFALSAVLGIVADLDDDGNEASKAKGNGISKPIPANIEGQEIYAAMSSEEKDYIRSHASSLIALHSKNGDLSEYVVGARLDHEEKLALWTQLPSDVRSAIKKQMKPTAAELASQP